MKKDNTSIRLKKIMEERNLKQIDILHLTYPFCQKYNIKMNKSDISQYVSGKNEPSQDKLVILGMALNVSESWLMGYDVPMGRGNSEESITPEIIMYYNQLNSLGQEVATEHIRLLTLDKKYTEQNDIITLTNEKEKRYLLPNAAHERTDIEITEEERIEDENMLD